MAASRWTIVRVGLVLLGLGQGAAALWALLSPRSFFDDFPGGGQHWVSALPPYNEHLIRDYGSSFTALAVLALVAAWIAERRLVRVALAVWLVAALPHLAFHLAHSDRGGGSIVSLTLDAVVPVILLFIVPSEVPKP